MERWVVVEFVCDPGPDALTVHVEIGRRGGLFSELAEMDVFSELAETDESKTSLTVASTDADAVAGQLREVPERHA